MTVIPDGMSSAGETLSLVCTVETVEGVRPEDIFITWIGPNGVNMEIRNLSTTGNVTTGRLVFSPLHTSDRGEYTCTGRIFNVGTDVSGNDSEKITVISKQSSGSVALIVCPCPLSPSSECVTISQY